MIVRLMYRLFYLIRFLFIKNSEDYVLFGSAFGYRDNSKYLLLRSLELGYQNFYWVAKSQSEFELLSKDGVPALLYGSEIWKNKVAHCKAAFFTHGIHDIAPSLPKDTLKVNLWHGIPLKKMGYDSEVDLKAIRRRKCLLLSDVYQSWDYLLASSEFSVNALKSSTRLPDDRILRAKQPRNFVLQHSSDGYESTDIVTYMPTYRDNGESKHITALLDWWPSIYAETGLKLCLKLHPLEKVKLNTVKHEWLVPFELLSESGDVQEILQKTNTLITDYSSVMFDFAITGRKVVIYSPDVKEYLKARGNGFYIPLSELKEFQNNATNRAELVRLLTCELEGGSLHKYADQSDFPEVEECFKSLGI
ncbi:hypothetical protein JL49_20915 [Pseudoalteromonas luteoviolacea]|nr:hypothetical protein JL49_20915 [Pseudoalteromonas luteoviolacea]